MNKQPRAELSALELRLGYRFRDPTLAQLALTHLSAQSAGGQGRAQSYQRLEFLGDRVLGVVDREPALSGLSPGERGRALDAVRQARAPRDLRRDRRPVGRRAACRARPRRSAGRRPQEGGDPLRRLRIADRRRVRRRRLCGRRGAHPPRLGRPDHRRRRARARRQDRGAGMGAVARLSPRRATRRSSAAARRTRPIS